MERGHGKISKKLYIMTEKNQRKIIKLQEFWKQEHKEGSEVPQVFPKDSKGLCRVYCNPGGP